MTTIRALVLLLAVLAAGPAWGLGALVGPEGGTITASRSLVVRYADRVQLVTQIKYAGSPQQLIWLLAVPNSNTPDETIANGGVEVRAFSQAALDELDGLTRPVLEGVCDGAPSGQSTEIVLAEQFGPAQPQMLQVRKYSVPDIIDGDLVAFLQGAGVAVDEPLQATIDEMVNQNFMMVALRIDTAALGVARVDPVVSVTWPQAAGTDLRVALRPLTVSLGNGPANLVLWTLDAQRTRTNVATEELRFDDVMFVSNVDTNYVQALDNQVGVRQTQMFVTEFAGAADDFTDADLAGAAATSGAGFLTRLRARIGAPALRTNLILVQLQGAGTAAYDRTHQVEGFQCGGEEPADMGVEPTPDADVVEEDMGPAPGDQDMGLVRDPDGGVPAGEGGGGDDGCVVAFGGPGRGSALLVLLAVLLSLHTSLRRRR